MIERLNITFSIGRNPITTGNLCQSVLINSENFIIESEHYRHYKKKLKNDFIPLSQILPNCEDGRHYNHNFWKYNKPSSAKG